MAYRLVWTNRALDNLEEIRMYIALDSAKYASRTVQKLFAASDTLKQFPNMGRIVPEDLQKRRREVIVRPYRLIYEVDEQTITVSVTRVIHGGRDLAAVLRAESD